MRVGRPQAPIARREVLLLALVAAAFAIAPSSASARILPASGIAGVEVGFSAAHVRHLLGRPSRVIAPTWVYRAPLDGHVGFNHRHRVNDVWTVNRRQRTRKGIGPGSSFAAMRRAYARAKCTGAKKGRRRLCTLTVHPRHRIVKCDFLFRGQLRKVDVYLVPASVKPGPK
jgi:hypothetical protein